MNYVALKPVNFGGKQYKIGEIIPEGVVAFRTDLLPLPVHLLMDQVSCCMPADLQKTAIHHS